MHVWDSATYAGVVSWPGGLPPSSRARLSRPKQATNPDRRLVTELYVDK